MASQLAGPSIPPSSDLWDKAVASLNEEDKLGVDFGQSDRRTILCELSEEIQRKKTACIERRLKYKKSNGNYVILYDVFEKIVRCIDTFKQVGDVAVQYDPGHATLPWAAVRFFLQASVNDVQILGALVDGIEVVCEIIARYAALERLYPQGRSLVQDRIQKALVATYASILVFFSKCRKNFDFGLGRRMLRNLAHTAETLIANELKLVLRNNENVTELTRIVNGEGIQSISIRQDHIDEEIGQLRQELQSTHLESCNALSRLESLLEALEQPLTRSMLQISAPPGSQGTEEKDKERKEIFNWLSTIQYKNHHRAVSKIVLEDTGTWLLQTNEYKRWRKESVSSILWLHGIPGSGKTCLLSTIIRQLLHEHSLSENAAPVAYFYCARTSAEPQRASPVEVLRAILKQLIIRDPTWQTVSETAKVYRARKKDADEDGSEIASLEMGDVVELIVDACERTPATIIIDALDECTPDLRWTLLDALNELLKKTQNLLKVLISSRDDMDIVMKLRNHPNIFLDVKNNGKDISRFISQELEAVIGTGRLLNGQVSPTLQRLIMETLQQQANGMFLWVSLQLQSLCDKDRIKIEDDVKLKLRRLPEGLSDIYRLLLGKIMHLERFSRAIAETALKWLLCSSTAGTAVMLGACAAAARTDVSGLHIQNVLDVCANLVVHDSETDTFRYAHLSVREFLELDPGYSRSESNDAIFTICAEIGLDRLPAAPHIVLGWGHWRPPAPETIEAYASIYWPFHYSQIELATRDRPFHRHLKNFLFEGHKPSSKFDTWADDIKRSFTTWDASGPVIDGFTNDDFSTIMQGEDYGIETATRSYYLTSPLDIATCFGWTEVFAYYETYYAIDEFYDYVMAWAIRFDQCSVVAWLFGHSVRLGKPEIILANALRRRNILELFSRAGVPNCIQEVEKFPADWTTWSLRAGHDLSVVDICGRAPSMASVKRKKSAALLIRMINRARKQPDNRNAFLLRLAFQELHVGAACVLLGYGIDPLLEIECFLSTWTGILDEVFNRSDYLCQLEDSVKDWPFPSDGLRQVLLAVAARLHYSAAFKIILRSGVDPSCPVLRKINEPWHTDALSSIFDSALRSSADRKLLEQRTLGRHTVYELSQAPLHWAALIGDTGLVSQILDTDIDPNIRNRDAETALHAAVQRPDCGQPVVDIQAEKIEIVKLLLENGATIKQVNGEKDDTMLLTLALRARYDRLARYLIECGIQSPPVPTSIHTVRLWQYADAAPSGIRKAMAAGTLTAPSIPLIQGPPSAVERCGPTEDQMDIAARLIHGGVMRILARTLEEETKQGCARLPP